MAIVRSWLCLTWLTAANKLFAELLRFHEIYCVGNCLVREIGRGLSAHSAIANKVSAFSVVTAAASGGVEYSSSDTVAAPDLVDTYDSVRRWKCVI